jgi:hypothetical protein
MALPNAIIAGVNKAGTTSLFNALAQQADVFPSRVKETHFFDPVRYGAAIPPLERYEELFPPAPDGGTVLEATPGYFYGGERMATALDTTLPGVRIAVVLREPGERAFSWWRFCRSRLMVDPDEPFAAYLARCEALGQAAEESPDLVAWRALSGGRYSDYLPWWQKVFGERLLVLFYDDLRQDFESATRRVAEHFGAVLHSPVSPASDNVTTDVRNTVLQRVALEVNKSGERLWRRAPWLKQAGRSAYYRVNARAAQQQLGDADRTWLTDYFTDERARLRLLVDGETSPVWLRGAG